MMDRPTYEDQFGPLTRRAHRVWRWLKWQGKGLFGKDRVILIETKWRLGDEVMALPLYEAMATAYPGARIEAVCTYEDLLRGNPFVSEVNPAAPKPDRYVLLRGAPRNVFRREHYASLLGLPVPEKGPALEPVSGGEDIAFGSIAVAPGASWGTKRWPREQWIELAQGLADSGMSVIELGTGDEALGVGRNLVGKTSVAEAAAVLGRCRLLVSHDSGLMHLALAVGTPVLALFGPTDPSILVRNEPLLNVVSNGRDCRGCWNVSMAMKEPGVCPLGIEPCMGTIETAAIRDKALDLLGRAS